MRNRASIPHVLLASIALLLGAAEVKSVKASCIVVAPPPHSGSTGSTLSIPVEAATT